MTTQCINKTDQYDRRENQMDISIETITPRVATEWLQYNASNRPLSKSVVDRYVREMRNGAWDNDGSPIRFSKTGRLLDGQHRLNAVAISRVSIEAVVMRGLGDDSFKTMDTGKSRGGADILGIAGFKNTTKAAAIASAWNNYLRTGSPGYSTGAVAATNHEILEICENNPEIREAAAFLDNNHWIKRNLVSMSSGTLYVAACKLGQREIMHQFFKELISPTARSIETSVMLLRDRLIESKGARQKMPPALQAALVFKAYRDFRDNRKVRQLKVVLHDGRITKDHFVL